MRRWPAMALTMVAISFAAPGARGAEGDIRTGAAASVAFASEDLDLSPFWDLQLDYGLSELFEARVEAGAGHDPESGAIALLRVAPQLGFRLDVVEWVPRASSGPALVWDSRSSELRFAGELSAGIDHLLAREWLVGVQYQLTAFIDDGSLLHRAGLRVMYRWGW